MTLFPCDFNRTPHRVNEGLQRYISLIRFIFYLLPLLCIFFVRFHHHRYVRASLRLPHAKRHTLFEWHLILHFLMATRNFGDEMLNVEWKKKLNTHIPEPAPSADDLFPHLSRFLCSNFFSLVSTFRLFSIFFTFWLLEHFAFLAVAPDRIIFTCYLSIERRMNRTKNSR